MIIAYPVHYEVDVTGHLNVGLTWSEAESAESAVETVRHNLETGFGALAHTVLVVRETEVDESGREIVE